MNLLNIVPIRQVHAKSREIKSFITQFTAILLNELPVTFNSLVFMGFSLKLIHDLDTDTTHSTAKMLYNVKSQRLWELAGNFGL